MPLLGGFFGKKSRSSARSNNEDLESNVSSPTASYVTTDKSIPSSPNGRSLLHPDSARNNSKIYPTISNTSSNASSSKLRLPFGRRKVYANSSTTSVTTPTMSPPRPSYADRFNSSDSEAPDLRPPLSKSAMFAAYADSNNALSTRSLPNNTGPSYPSTSPPPPPPKERKHSLFAWAKTANKNTTTSPDTKPPANSDPPDSFNLKSFRHIRPPSPNVSTSSLVVPPARPRGTSVNSESSQRISVAAFREAQARRSTAGSPVPSFRSPSPSFHPPSSILQDGQRGRASPRPPPSTRSSPHLRAPPEQRRRSSSIAVGYTSESEESTSSEEDDSDEDERGVRRNGTITQRTRPLIGTRQAKSEMGHGHSKSYASSNFLTTARSQVGHGDANNTRQNSYALDAKVNSPTEVLCSQSSLGSNVNRPRASVSTSALSPTAAAKRASILVNANSSSNQDQLLALKQANRHVRDSSVTSNPSNTTQLAVKAMTTNTNDSDTSDSESDDNAPLASLVPPRRPGSAMSAASNSSLRTTATGTKPSIPSGRSMSKPLIDINELRGQKPTVRSNRDDGFTRGGLLGNQMSMNSGLGSTNLTSKQTHPNQNQNQNQTQRQQQYGQQQLVESPTSIYPPSSLSPLPSPPLATVTSKVPPSGFTQFVPPTSPPKEIQAYFDLDARLSPSNINTPPSSLSQSPHSQPLSSSQSTTQMQQSVNTNTRNESTSPERRRDMIAERLARLTKGKMNGNGNESMDDDVIVKGKNLPLAPPTKPQRTISNQPESPKKSPLVVKSTSTNEPQKLSSSDEDLIQSLDDGILAYISRTGDDDDVDEVQRGRTGSASGNMMKVPVKDGRKVGVMKDSDSDTSSSHSDSDSDSESESDDSYKGRTDMRKKENQNQNGGNTDTKNNMTNTNTHLNTNTYTQKSQKEEVSREPSPDRIAPIPIKQRAPAPSFSVMSRPPIQKLSEGSGSGSGSGLGSSTDNNNGSSVPIPSPTMRPRSSTLMPLSNSTSTSTTTSNGNGFGNSTSSFAKLKGRGGSSVNGHGNESVERGGQGQGSKITGTGTGSRTMTTTPLSSPTRSTNSPIPQQQQRQRSSTLLPTSQSHSYSNSNSQSQSQSQSQSKSGIPLKPFAVRRDSPASSTGDSSSGRAPLTPRDGSDIGISGGSGASTSQTGIVGEKRSRSKSEDWGNGNGSGSGSGSGSGIGTGSGVSGFGTVLGGNAKGLDRHMKRRSVSFGNDVKDDDIVGLSMDGKKDVELNDPEARRKERRRNEARAAIELGNIINGPTPDISDDEDMPINQALNTRMSAVNPMMAMGTPMQMQMPFNTPNPNAWGSSMQGVGVGGGGWSQQQSPAAQQMLSPQQFMMPPPTDPNYMIAHQQAMMFAKQAYQMAVAQQAMAAAADEWERSSVMGGSVYGGPTSNASMLGGVSPYGMGMGVGLGGWSSGGSAIFSNGPRSVYGGGGISSSRSEYGAGGGGGGNNWNSSRSMYGGESYNNSSDRLRPDMVGGRGGGGGGGGGGDRSSRNSRMMSGYFPPPVPPMPSSQSGNGIGNGRGRQRTSSQPAINPSSPQQRLGQTRKAPPPSSWRSGV